MRYFLPCALLFCLNVFLFSAAHAQEKSTANAPLAIVVNQALEPALTAPMPVVSNALKQVPLAPDVSEKATAVIANQQAAPAVLEKVESSTPVTVMSIEHSPLARMKQLAGRWEGSGENVPGDKQNKIVVVYEVTAGGNAVLERIFPGSAQEMITMYYEEKGQLALTHYCLIGTRSVMKLKALEANSDGPKDIYEFNLVESPGLNPLTDTHMHSLKISFIDENHMNQSWEMFEAGKLSGSYSFVLARASKNP